MVTLIGMGSGKWEALSAQAQQAVRSAGQRDRAQILDLFLFQPSCVGLLRFIVHMLSSCVFCQHSPACAGLCRPAAAKKR